MITLHSLSPTTITRPSDQLPLGRWLFLPKSHAAAMADASTSALPPGILAPESLALS